MIVTAAPLPLRWVDAQVLTVRPGDTLVLSHPEALSMDAERKLAAQVKALFPETRVLVLMEGMTLGVLRS